MSFMDLLGSPLVIYDCPTNVDDVHLPQLPAFPDQNLSVPNAANIDDVHLPQPTLEPPTFLSQDLSAPKDRYKSTAEQVGSMVLHEVAMGTREASAPHTSVPDTCLSQPPAGARDPPQALGNASWKIQNPGQPIIPPCGLEKLDATQRAARKIASEQRNKREESLANALICIKVHQVNADHPCSQKFQLKELQEMVVNDQGMQNLDKVMKQKYLRELKESCNCHTEEDLWGALACHTGIYACLFVTHGHVYDMHAVTWFGTDNIMDFWEDHMKLSPDYIIKQLELWACNEEKNIEACDSLENMQKQAKNGLNSGFVSIAKHLHQEKPIHL
ncbi:hypothetical protein BKA83DRAFT_4493304 [Pisolithus microcarpus]|nr:hypothetical protein BKA83DRAFT_4493304 [Pisolithus microcarpus]